MVSNIHDQKWLFFLEKPRIIFENLNRTLWGLVNEEIYE